MIFAGTRLVNDGLYVTVSVWFPVHLLACDRPTLFESGFHCMAGHYERDTWYWAIEDQNYSFCRMFIMIIVVQPNISKKYFLTFHQWRHTKLLQDTEFRAADGETGMDNNNLMNCIRLLYKTIDFMSSIQLDIPNVNFLIINKFRR